MRWLGVTLLATLSVVALLLAMQPELQAPVIGGAFGVRVTQTFRTTATPLLAIGGFLGIALAVAQVVRAARGRTDHRLWAAALAPFAAEHGRNVRDQGRRGVGFTAAVGGDRIDVVLQPRGAGFVSVWCDRPGRLKLMVMSAATPGAGSDDETWRIVGRRRDWELRAELPASCRPLMSDPTFLADMDRLMAYPSVRALRHDGLGMEVVSDLVAPDELTPLLRAALGAMRRLRVVNA